MDILRTPDARFEGLEGWPYAPHYVEVDGLRIHFVDEGPRDAPPVLLLHGEPTWGYLYRKVIPPLVAAGHRVVVPDLVGFGRSDKPAQRSAYTYANHVAWLEGVLDRLELQRITLFCQDWGGLLGLRIVARQPDRFARVVAANTFLPTGTGRTAPAFHAWRAFARFVPRLPISGIVRFGCVTKLSPAVLRAYDAPFPEERFKAGARAFPLLVPTRPDDPGGLANVAAWESLAKFDRPFLTAFSDGDPITRGADRSLRKRIAGAHDQPHTTIRRAGHFLQEDQGEAVARVVADFIAGTAGVSKTAS